MAYGNWFVAAITLASPLTGADPAFEKGGGGAGGFRAGFGPSTSVLVLTCT